MRISEEICIAFVCSEDLSPVLSLTEQERVLSCYLSYAGTESDIGH